MLLAQQDQEIHHQYHRRKVIQEEMVELEDPHLQVEVEVEQQLQEEIQHHRLEEQEEQDHQIQLQVHQ